MPVCCGHCHGKLSSRRWKTCPCCGSKLSKNDIVDCKYLSGSGSIKMYPCKTCKGKRVVPDMVIDHMVITWKKCPKCNGSGRRCDMVN